MHSPDVTIVVVPRDHFSDAREFVTLEWVAVSMGQGLSLIHI